MEKQQEGLYLPSVSETFATFPVRKGNKVLPLIDSIPFYDRVFSVISQAKKSAWLAVSFFHREIVFRTTGETFFQFISRIKKEKNLDIRILFWKNPHFILGTKTLFNGLPGDFEFLKKNDIDIAIRWDESLQKEHCHHEKTWIVDAGEETEVCFLGGIVLSHYGSIRGHQPSQKDFENGAYVHQVHDVNLEIQGPATTDIVYHFVQRWNHAMNHSSSNGHFPDLQISNNLSFPEKLAPIVGEDLIQIQRSIMPNIYNSIGKAIQSPTSSYNLLSGEESIFQQYIVAINEAKKCIYLENQHLAHDLLIDYLIAAAKRGVRIFYLVPGEGIGAAVHVRKQVEHYIQQKQGKDVSVPKYGSLFLEKFPAIKNCPNFCVAGLLGKTEKGNYMNVYVHSKLAIVDMEWFTVGSANLVDLSFEKDHTELNASVWSAKSARDLFLNLTFEHTGKDLSDLDAKSAIEHLSTVANENRELLMHKKPIQGNIYAVDAENLAFKMETNKITWYVLYFTVLLGVLLPLFGTPAIRFSSLIVIGSQTFSYLLVMLTFPSPQVLEVTYPLSFIFEAVSTLFWFREKYFTLNRPLIATLAIVIWATRLSVFCWMRLTIFKYYRGRFNPLWRNLNRMTIFLIFQFLTVFANNSTIVCINSNSVCQNMELQLLDYIGLFLFVTGFIMESIADWHKLTSYEYQTENRSLWKYSKHPNYFGESLVWWGIYLMSVPCEGITFFGLLGPVHTTLALLFFSGVLGGNEIQDQGGISEYEKKTSVFIPLPTSLGKYVSNSKYEARNRCGWGLGMYMIESGKWCT